MEDLSAYNKEGTNLRRAQLTMLSILKNIIVVFENNNIPYWVDYGTALGAARHKGFIPWDDDLDITIPEKYYYKAICILTKELPDDFVVQSKENTPNYPNKHFKVRDIHSIYVEDGYESFEYRGIFVDIFPAKKTNILIQKVINIYNAKICNLNLNRNKFVNYRYIFFKSIVIFSKILLHILIKKHHVIPFFEKKIIPLNLIYPLSKCMFEDIEVSCPNDMYNYLKLIYGDFQKLPSVENRITHAKQIIFKH